MNARAEPDRSKIGQSDDVQAAVALGGETDAVDTLPVLAEAPAVVAHAYRVSGGLASDRGSAGAVMPAVQAAAVAAGGFVAGAAVLSLVHRRQRHSAAIANGRRAGRRLGRQRRSGRGAPTAGELIQIVGSRSLLVDVHLLGGRD